MRTKIFIVAALALLGFASCEAEKAVPQPPKGKTAVRQDFERLAAKNDMAVLDGWLNIMYIDTTYTKPFLCWQGAVDGCNIVAMASAHLFDDSNAGIKYESWLISPPLDLDNAVNRNLSFRILASYWQSTDSLNVFYMRSVEDIGSSTPPVPLKDDDLRIPQTSNDEGVWMETDMNLNKLSGTVLIGFRYRALGGRSKSTSYAVDDFAFGAVDAQPAGTIFEEPFFGTLGQFTQVSRVGAQTWRGNTSAGSAPYSVCAKISGFQNSNNANEDWLISPPIDLSEVRSAVLSFDQSINMGSTHPDTIALFQQVLVSTNCADASSYASATWVPLEVEYPGGESWSFACSGKNSLDAYAGKSNVRIAFKYTSTTTSCASWGIRNLRISTN